MNRISCFCLLLITGVATDLLAHPGHAPLERGLSHVLASPFHLFVLIMPAVALFAAARFIARPATRRLIYSGATTFLVLAGVQLLRLFI